MPRRSGLASAAGLVLHGPLVHRHQQSEPLEGEFAGSLSLLWVDAVEEGAVQAVMNVDLFSRSWTAWYSIQVKKTLKRTGAIMQPCFTPLLITKASITLPLEKTWPVMPSWKSLIINTNFGGHPMRSRTIQSASLLTVSKALVRSMNPE